MSKILIYNEFFLYSQCNSEISPNDLSVNFNYQKSQLISNSRLISESQN